MYRGGHDEDMAWVILQCEVSFLVSVSSWQAIRRGHVEAMACVIQKWE